MLIKLLGNAIRPTVNRLETARAKVLRKNWRAMALTGLLFFWPATSSAEVSADTASDFSNTDAQGWRNGVGSDHVQAVAGGGPGGIDDPYLRVFSDSPGVIGSRLVTFNIGAAWAGDYIGAALSALDLQVANLELSEPAVLRIAFSDNATMFGNWWVSTVGFVIPADGHWHHATLPISESALSRVSGTGTYSQVLGAVGQVRLLINQELDYRGEAADHDIGFDNLRLRHASNAGHPVFADQFEP